MTLNTPDMLATTGLHHVTATASDPQLNLDFYRGMLGLNLVKTTVNFDNPFVYHLYFGDSSGLPGTIYTSFPFPDARQGRAGPGMASTIGFSRPDASDHAQALQAQGIAIERLTRFGAPVWAFTDPDGQRLELSQGPAGLSGVTLWLEDPEPTAALLKEVFGYTETGREADGPGRRQRLALSGSAPGRIIDLYHQPDAAPARSGAGTVHHIAFRARDRAHQDALTEALRARGLRPSERKDRNYFESTYTREPGGVLFEIATDAPGFAHDEPPETLGQSLKLPPQHEPRRAEIEARLPRLGLGQGT